MYTFYMSSFGRFVKKYKFDILIYFLFALFSAFLMWKTFRYEDGYLLIGTRVWSDFSATFPLIRSFSFGSNFPPQYPLFANAPIRFHFWFFVIVGFLEKIGVRIDWALNLISTLFFFVLLAATYEIGKKVFKSKSVGVLSSIFVVFNSSFGFVEFFRKYGITKNIIKQIIQSNQFTSFGPYDGKTVSAFWNLNIYTNQRHLSIAYATFLLISYFLYKKRNDLQVSYAIILGWIIGVFPFIHLAVFGTLIILLGVSFLIYPKIRKPIFVSGVVAVVLALPQFIYMGKAHGTFDYFSPGYLVQNLTVLNFITYWFMNLGLPCILAPIGFLMAEKNQRKFILPFLLLFFVGNIFQFSPEKAANHKFFNLFAIGISFLTSLFLVKVWKKNVFGKILASFIFIPLILTGFLDIFPIINDEYMVLADVKKNPAANFVLNNTRKDSVFLNSSYLYTPENIAGRKIYLGWPYFSWSAGYDVDRRVKVMEKIFTSSNKMEVCKILKAEKIDYVSVQDTSGDRDFAKINLSFFNSNFKFIYSDKVVSIFSTSQNCP